MVDTYVCSNCFDLIQQDDNDKWFHLNEDIGCADPVADQLFLDYSRDDSPTTTCVIRTCPFCQTPKILELDLTSYLRWKQDHVYVQHAFDYLTPGQREEIINGSCEQCFDEAFGKED